MARERIVTAHREILSDDVNDISSYLIYDLEVAVKEVIGASSGVVNGLEVISYSGLDVTIPSGRVLDSNGRFYESLSNQIITLPSTDAIYKIYAYKTSVEDTPTSGYILMDTETRIESYGIVNKRRYDALLFSYTTSTVPSSGYAICDATVSSSTISGIDDTRVFVTVDNIMAYSLQDYSNSGKNKAYRANKMTGYVYDDTDSSHNKFINVTVDSSHAGYPIYINNGTNVGTIGSTIIAQNNISYKSISNGSASGFVANGINSNDYGFIGRNNKTNLLLLNNISDSNTHNIETISSGNAITSYHNYTNIIDSGTAQYIKWTSGNVSSDFLGLEIDNLSSQNKGTAIYINKDNSSNNFDYGLYLRKSSTGIVVLGDNTSTNLGIYSKDNIKGAYFENLNQANGNYQISTYTSGAVLTNYGIYNKVKGKGIGQFIECESGNEFVGIRVKNASGTTDINGIEIGEGNVNNFNYGLVITKSDTALKIDNCTNGINITTAYTSGAINTASYSVGLDIDNSDISLRIKEHPYLTHGTIVGTNYGYNYLEGGEVVAVRDGSGFIRLLYFAKNSTPSSSAWREWQV